MDGTATTNYLANVSSASNVNNAITDILAAFHSLDDGAHTLQLTMHNPGDTDTVGNSTTGPIIAFDRAVIYAAAG